MSNVTLGEAWAAAERALPAEWWMHLYVSKLGYRAQAKWTKHSDSEEARGSEPVAVLDDLVLLLQSHVPGAQRVKGPEDQAEADRLAALACGEPDGKPCTVPDCPWCHANPTTTLAENLDEASWAIATGASRARALALIFAERTLQDAKWGSQRQHPDKMWLTILLEEVGEIARAILEGTPVKPELVQVAAVALCWLEALEK